MACRHAEDDPACGSYGNNVRRARALVAKDDARQGVASTPDNQRYQIVRFERIGPHVVVQVLYPNCAKCSYEGNKVMVFENVSEATLIQWRIIDPHFREPSVPVAPTEAPSPVARFPASAEGWSHAVNFVRAILPA